MYDIYPNIQHHSYPNYACRVHSHKMHEKRFCMLLSKYGAKGTVFCFFFAFSARTLVLVQFCFLYWLSLYVMSFLVQFLQ